MKTTKNTLEDRYGLKINLLSNLNYYGNLDAKLYGKPTKKVVTSTLYEELHCISYHPTTEELRSTIHIKSELGTSNGPNYEYVRYYIDYENNGNWQDVGVTRIKIHNVGKHEGLCYGIKLKISPEVIRRCNQTPVLPMVRAILSWDIAPPAVTPEYLPIWGNVKEARVQIAPNPPIVLPNINFPVNFDFISYPTINGLPLVNLKKKGLQLDVLKNTYQKEVDDSRLLAMSLKDINTFNLKDIKKWKTKLDLANINFTINPNILSNSQFNTSYEELKCISFNNTFSELHADIHIKKRNGYSGGLCSEGSREYVAFYMDFGSGWQYMGTSSVKVFDIEEIPIEGLWYNVFLPVNLAPYAEEIQNNKTAKIKGILSWNTVPEPENPNFVASWGDWEECETGLKGIALPTDQMENQPWIQSIGNVDTAIINQTTGLANGVSLMGNNIEADFSPFDGAIYIKGLLLNATTDIKYRVMIKEPNATTSYALTKQFEVGITYFVDSIPQEDAILQRPIDGYYNYLPKSTVHMFPVVNDNLLGIFKPTESGIHKVYIESETGQRSDEILFTVDKDRPEVDIDIVTGSGNCGKFPKGKEITGTFEVKNDTHLNTVSLWLAPSNSETAIEIINFDISGSDTGTKTNNTILVNDTDSDLDSVDGTWKINTKTLVPCGYTVHIKASDRTIVNSSYVGKSSSRVSRGFCLE